MKEIYITIYIIVYDTQCGQWHEVDKDFSESTMSMYSPHSTVALLLSRVPVNVVARHSHLVLKGKHTTYMHYTCTCTCT